MGQVRKWGQVMCSPRAGSRWPPLGINRAFLEEVTFELERGGRGWYQGREIAHEKGEVRDAWQVWGVVVGGVVSGHARPVNGDSWAR